VGCSTQALGREGNAAIWADAGLEADAPGEIAVKFTPLSGDVIGKDQCKKLQSFIMSIETAKNLSGLFKLTTAR